jgi:hypothetical protein
MSFKQPIPKKKIRFMRKEDRMAYNKLALVSMIQTLNFELLSVGKH